MSNMHSYYHEMKRSKKHAEDIASKSLKTKKRLERRVPLLLFLAIAQVMLYKAGQVIPVLAALFVIAMVGCAIHSAHLIRSYDRIIGNCQNTLDRIKKEFEQESEQRCEQSADQRSD